MIPYQRFCLLLSMSDALESAQELRMVRAFALAQSLGAEKNAKAKAMVSSLSKRAYPEIVELVQQDLESLGG